MSTELERISCIPADVLVAYDGAEALRFLDGPGPSPDLIVLDLSLPRFGGLEILRRHPPTDGPPPVVVFTGSSNLEERARAMELGASD